MTTTFPFHRTPPVRVLALPERNMLTSLMIAVSIHLASIAIILVTAIEGEEQTPDVGRRGITISYPNVPVPSFPNRGVIAAAPSPTRQYSRPKIGLPIPVPDADLKNESDIALTSHVDAGVGGGDISGSFGADATVGESPTYFSDEPLPEEFRAVEKEPVPVIVVNPEYPRIPRQLGIDGTVYVKMLVARDGRVKNAFILKSVNEALDEAALIAAKQWVFVPALMNAGPVAVWTVVPFHFKLTK